MIVLDDDKTITIYVYETGWIINWTRANHFEHDNSVGWPPGKMPEPKTQGNEVFTDESKFLRRLHELLGVAGKLKGGKK